jgi:hypothetical protein
MENKRKVTLFSEADNDDKSKDTDKADKGTETQPEETTPPDDTPEDTSTSETKPENTDLHNDVDDSNDPDVHSDNLDNMFDDIFSGNGDNQPTDGNPDNVDGGEDNTNPDDMNLDGGTDGGDNQELGTDDSVYLGDDENKGMEDAVEDEEAITVIVKERFIKLYDKYDKKSTLLDKTDFNKDIEDKINPIISEYLRVTEQLYNYITNVLSKDGIAVQIKSFTEFKFLLETLDNQVAYVLVADEDEQL